MSSGFITIYAPSVLALSITLPIIDIVVVALRLYARKKQKVPVGVDDYLCVAALIFTLGCAATLISGAALHAVGYPTPFVDLTDGSATSTVNRYIQITSQVEWVLDLLSVVALGLIKLSFLFFLRRVFCTRANPNSFLSKVLTGMIGLITAWTAAFFFAWLFVCRGDFAAWWGPYVQVLEKCPNAYLLLYATGVTDVILDGIVVLLPLPVIFRLNLSLQKKLAIAAVFMCGLVVVGASLARLILITASSSTDPSTDEDLFITQYVWWTMFEVGIALAASCFTNLRPLIPEAAGHKILQSLKSTYSRVSLSRSRRSASHDSTAKAKQTASMELTRSSASGHSASKSGRPKHVDCAQPATSQSEIWVQRDISVTSTAGNIV